MYLNTVKTNIYKPGWEASGSEDGASLDSRLATLAFNAACELSNSAIWICKNIGVCNIYSVHLNLPSPLKKWGLIFHLTITDSARGAIFPLAYKPKRCVFKAFYNVLVKFLPSRNHYCHNDIQVKPTFCLSSSFSFLRDSMVTFSSLPPTDFFR